MPPRFQVFPASILLEPNRWKPGRVPSICASEWSGRAAAAGFDGWELFENHHRLASAAEQEALRNSPLPVRVFNSYAAFDPADAPAREAARQAAIDLRAGAMKFNVGNAPAQLRE
jgi:sugar phosphate isomerase/epimerase